MLFPDPIHPRRNKSESQPLCSAMKFRDIIANLRNQIRTEQSSTSISTGNTRPQNGTTAVIQTTNLTINFSIPKHLRGGSVLKTLTHNNFLHYSKSRNFTKIFAFVGKVYLKQPSSSGTSH